MAEAVKDSSVNELTNNMSELTVLSFRKVDEVKRLAKHFRNVIDHPITQQNATISKYLMNLDETHRNIFLKKRETVEVEYILTTEKKSSMQRQRFNSLPVSEVPELLKTEFLAVDNAKQVHICTDCDVEIEMNDEEPLMESLQKHFNLDVHLPKLKRESIDVSEPVILPNMSRRLSAMECGEMPTIAPEKIAQMQKSVEKPDSRFLMKLETSLIRLMPEDSEANINAALKFYMGAYEKLCQEINSIDFTILTSSVAPIIMSIKDNVNQNFATDANKNFDNDESEQAPEKPSKNQAKKYRYYGPIEALIVKLLSYHKLMTLVDDRTGKPAFFCMACEYYTLRFRYDSVLNHVFSDTHVHNLSCIMQADKHVPFDHEDRSIESVKIFNNKFLSLNGVATNNNGENTVQTAFNCNLCKIPVETQDAAVLHVLEENHLAKMSDKMYHKLKANGSTPENWGPKSLDWAKFLAGTGKALTNKDSLVIENFIKPSGKVANYCSCCDMTLKGPRQVLFNHIRQKKHLRNAAPHKLSMLFRNYCRPSEYFASFGNLYACTVCPEYSAQPSFAGIVEHFESAVHVDTIAKMIRTALYVDGVDRALLDIQHIDTSNGVKCTICDVTFENMSEAMLHAFSNVQHQNAVFDYRSLSNKGDIINVYMNGNYIVHNEGATFNCTVCSGVFNSLRALLMHLVYAEHFEQRPTSESVFRFYLELKHNINLLSRNKYAYYEFGRLRCGVCGDDVAEGENAKRHVVSARHRENMGATYVNVHADVSSLAD